MKTVSRCILAFFEVAIAARAGVLFTVEAPGVQFSTRPGVIVEPFDSLPLGPLGPYTSLIGQYSAGGSIQAPDFWGGSNQTRYIAVGVQSGTTAFTLNFGKAITYFGLYWGAEDPKNVLEFYDGAKLIASVKSADWASTLPATYFGNPNTGVNKGEKYAFLNFDAKPGYKFDSVRFVNTLGTGFETDSHTIYAAPAVPEPSTWAMIGIAAAGLLLAGKRQRI